MASTGVGLKEMCFEQQKGYEDMTIIVKGEITITKGFDTWKSMVKKNKNRMDEMGMVMLFAGVKKMTQQNFTPS